MPIPDYQSLMEPVLLKAANGVVSVRSVIEQIGDELGLSEAERSQLLASGRKRVLDDRVHWAKSYLTQAGLLELTRGNPGLVKAPTARAETAATDVPPDRTSPAFGRKAGEI